MRFVVVGAGAVGGVLGGYLALRQHEVVLCCRDEHAVAIQQHGGLRIKSATGEFVAHVGARSSLEGLQFDGVCILLTAKSYDTESCVRSLAVVAPSDTPVLSFQNGIANEDVIAEHFPNVFGGVCRMTCSFLQPGQVTLRKPGRLVVGKHPKGADPVAKQVHAAFADAGFDVSVSRTILADKWLKLVVNLQSTWHAIVETRDHDTREFVDLKAGVLEEARTVLKRAKIKAKPCDGKDMNIDEMLADLRKPHASQHSSAVRVNNSTWQNLYLGRQQLENSYFHQPIIDLANKQGIGVPYNETALELVRRCSRERLGANSLRVGDVAKIVCERGVKN